MPRSGGTGRKNDHHEYCDAANSKNTRRFENVQRSGATLPVRDELQDRFRGQGEGGAIRVAGGLSLRDCRR